MIGKGITKINNFIWHILNMLITAASCSIGTRALCLGTNWLGHEGDHSSPSGAEVKNECVTVPTFPLHAFITCTVATLQILLYLMKCSIRYSVLKESYCIFMKQICASTNVGKYSYHFQMPSSSTMIYNQAFKTTYTEIIHTTLQLHPASC